MSLLLDLHAKWQEQRKKEAGAGGGTVYKLDSFPSPTSHEAFLDNHRDKLAPARLERYPLGTPEELWYLMPVWRPHTYRSIDLRPWGLNSQVAEEAIAILHDRRVQWKLSWFARINATISSRQMKTKTSYTVNGSTTSSTALDWKELTSFRCAQDALLAFQICLSLIWPLDLTGLVLLKVLTEYHMIANAEESIRVAVITSLFDRVSNTNRQRTVRKEPPMNYKEISSELKVCLRDYGLSENPPTVYDGKIPKLSADQKSLANLQASLPASGTKGGRSSTAGSSRRKLATVKAPSGNFVCYNWNSGNCQRQRTADGCKDPTTGKEFAHNCLGTNSAGGYCLSKSHPKKDHR
jgi:hypothetical protein